MGFIVGWAANILGVTSVPEILLLINNDFLGNR